MGKELFNKIELFLFDMDGLLFDTETIYGNEGKRIAKKHGYELTEDLIERTTGITNEKAAIVYREEFGKEFPFEDYMNEIKECIAQKAKKGEVPLMKGALEILEFLKENNKKMVLATSSNLEMVNVLTESKDIKKYFSHFVTSEDVTHGKPDPEVFLKGAEKEEVNPENVMVFEDSFNGIRAAHRAGMYPVMVPDKLKPNDEIKSLYFKEFESLEDVIEYLKAE